MFTRLPARQAVPPELRVGAAHWCLVTSMLLESLRATGSSHLQGLLKDILLENSPGSRVVYESSCLEQWGHINWDDIGWGCSLSAAVCSLLRMLTCQKAHRPLYPSSSNILHHIVVLSIGTVSLKCFTT